MPARLVPIAVGRTAGAVSGIAESGLIHRLTRGRLWIGLLATLLVGIVAMNVMALSFNATASRTGLRTDVLKRQISILRTQITAAGASNERVQPEAMKLGLTTPEPTAITYLTPRPDDAATAADRLLAGDLVAGAPQTSTPAASTSTTSADATPTSTTTTVSVPAPASPGPAAAAPAPAAPPSTPGASAGTAAPADTAPVSSSPPTAAGPSTPASSAGGGTSAGGGIATP